MKVQLRSPSGESADGIVKLQQGDTKHACQTRGGECVIPEVAGGHYTVTVEQEGKTAPKPKKVMIPPSGEVSLIVRGGT